MIYDFFLVFWIFFWNWNKTITIEDTLILIAHSIMEIIFRIFFISSTFLIRFTVQEILRVFWKKKLSKIRKIHVLRDCYGNTNNFVTSVFVKVYGSVYWKVEVQLLFFFHQILTFLVSKKFSKSKIKKKFRLKLSNV